MINFAEFQDVLIDASRKAGKVSMSEVAPHGEVPVIDQSAKGAMGYCSAVDGVFSGSLPAIVFGDHTRVVKFCEEPFVKGADGVKILEVRPGWDPRYIYWVLVSINIPSAGYSRHFKFLKESKIPERSLEEQRRIAGILDQADAIRTKRRAVCRLLDELKIALFDQLIRTSGEVGRCPIGQLGTVVTGKTPPTADKANFEGPVPFVTPGDLGLRTKTARTLSDVGATKSRVVRAGSTLVCCIGDIGKASAVDVASAFNQQINAIVWGPLVNDKYGEFAVRSIRYKIVARGSSTTLPIISKSKFEQLTIPVVPLKVQEEFAARVEQINAQRALVERALEKDEELFASLQSRAFSGEL